MSNTPTPKQTSETPSSGGVPPASSTLRSAAISSIGTLLSRVLGLARDVATATFFGASAAVDAFFIAFMLPNLFRKLFGEGALSAAAIPVLSRYKEQQSLGDVSRLSSSLLTRLALTLFVIVALGCSFVWFANPDWFGLGAEEEKWASFRLLFVSVFPLVLFVCLAALQGSILNTFGRFGVFSLMPALQNAIWIGAILIAVFVIDGDVTHKLQIVCFGIVLGGAIQVAVQARSIRKLGLTIRPSLGRNEQGIRDVRKAMLPTLFPIAVFQVNALLDLLFAEYFVSGHGAVSSYSYATRLYQFPLGIVGVAIASAIYPMLTRYASRGEGEKVTGGLLNGLRLLAFVALPACAGLLALNHEIVRAVYVRGEFTSSDADRVSRVLFFFSLALPFVAAQQIITRAYYAIGDMRTPMKIAVASVVVNVSANLVLVQTTLQEAGLAAGTALSALFQVFFLSRFLRRQLGGTLIASARLSEVGPISDRLASPLSRSLVRNLTFSVLRAGLISGVMALGVVMTMRLLPSVENGHAQGVLITLCGVGLGILFYLLAGLLFAKQDLKELLRLRKP